MFNAPGLQTIALDALVIDKATELRARHRLRTPDALQAASLLTHAPDGTLVTGDGDFLKVPGLHVRHIIITPRP
ncbi:type II toxin-antitoxin system VapC family toxin [Aquisalimonas sp. 2447]|nr:PIN domain-containing protein [Aquisalimonas sp. 2447]QIT55849.1 type II toxin-antitoxin system VapC family toxin [Aquisalimonas sp. 2447]